MTKSPDWMVALESALCSLPGELGLSLLADWEPVAREARVIVSLVGVFDTGKSTLLKRLLVDAGAPVPEWLTISARPETFIDNSVEVHGCLFRDTPGLASGNAEHDTLALDATALSDVIWLLLPPQLVTSAQAQVEALVSGRSFHLGGWAYPAGAIRLVVSRIDEAGGDPVEDLEGFQQLMVAKREQVEKWLTASRLPFLPISLVAPDPDGRVKNAPATRAMYDEGRSWDGICALEEEIARLSLAIPALRRAARERFLLRAATRALEAVAEELRIERGRADELEKELERRDHALSELETISAHARADLDRIIEEALTTLRRAGTEPDEKLTELAKTRFGEMLGQWAERHDEQLVQFARKLEVDFAALARRPAVQALFVGKSPAAEKKGPTNANKLGNLSARLRGILEVGHQAHLGFSLGEARKKLADPSFLRKLGDNAEKVKAASQRWHIASVLVGDVVPLATELGSLLYDEYRRAEDVKERKRRREALQTELREWARKVATLWFDGDAGAGLPGWRSNADRLKAGIEAHFASVVQQRLSSTRAVEELGTCEAQLRAAMDAAERAARPAAA